MYVHRPATTASPRSTVSQSRATHAAVRHCHRHCHCCCLLHVVRCTWNYSCNTTTKLDTTYEWLWFPLHSFDACMRACAPAPGLSLDCRHITHAAPPLHAMHGVGKTAMLAGATDERIAITNPNNSGIGGASLNRLKGVGSEEVNSFWTDGEID